MIRPGLAGAAFVACVVLTMHAARADVGGAIVLKGLAGAETGKDQERIDLSSFSWINPTPPTGVNSAYIGERAPEKGHGALTIAKAVTAETPVLESYCTNDKTLPEVLAEIPLWEERFADNKLHYQQYRLKDVKVAKCAHMDGAVAKIFRLEFSDIEAIPMSEKPIAQRP